MPLIGAEYATSPHRFEVSVHDRACGYCRSSENARVHQPFWWRWFNPKKQYRN